MKNKIIDFLGDYSFLLSEAICKAKYRRGIKILTTRQMLRRLPVALVQVKAGNISENFWSQTNHMFFV